ncbi:hypothetical protein NKR23_g10868 [Pleurostoma richardsiae]|uniref:Uncharacterized protein n=1 Tax=Pleurostoma richardsiae TaxID=41990 RepID=A0AA38VHZ2_9PEZI|nr:hypothetical protein NKR23_g10868 [Pleurostoma richardsiae]
MNFGTRTDDAPNEPGLTEATNIPGAYPTDDVPGQSAGTASASEGWDLNGTEKDSHRNKLHKRNDPRGWDSEKIPRGHQHIDSGIGLPESDIDPNPRGSNNQSAGAGLDGPNYTTSKHEDMVPGTGEATRPGAVLGPSHQETAGEKTRDDRPTAEGATQTSGAATSGSRDEGDLASSKNPYWGDLPRGTGVYNTVIGHGSQEEDQGRREAQARGSDAVFAKPKEHTSNASDSADRRAFPLAINDHSGEGELPQAAPGTQGPRHDRHRGDMNDATAAAAAAYAAHATTSLRDTEQQVGKERETEPPKVENESKLYALFHRGQGSKEDKAAKKEKPRKEHSKQEKQDTVFVPTRVEEDQHDTPNRASSRVADTTSNPARGQERETAAKDSHLGPSLASAAAGGAAGYGASKFIEQEKSKHEEPPMPTYDKPTTVNPSQRTSAQSRSIAGKDHNAATKDTHYDVLPSGTPSGIKQQNDGDADAMAPSFTPVAQGVAGQSIHAQSEPTARKTQYGVLPTGTSSGAKTDSKDVTSKTERPPTAAREQAAQERDIPEHSATKSRSSATQAVAGGASAVVGGAALASASSPTSPRKDEDVQPSSTDKGEKRASSSSQYKYLASGTPSGMNPSRG